MKKKLVPVLVVIAFIAVAVAAFYMGQQSATPAVDDLPAQSGASEPDNEKSPTSDVGSETVEYLQGDGLIALFQKVYDDVAEQDYPQEYRLQTELLLLPDYNDTGKELPTDYEEQYLAWRPEDKVTEPESEIPEGTQQPSNPQPSNPPAQQPSNPPSGGNSNVDANGDGFPDSWQMADPNSGSGQSSDHTGETNTEGGSVNTDHGYGGITIGTSSGNENSEAAKNGDGWPDAWEMADSGSGEKSDKTGETNTEGGTVNTDHGYSGITIN